MYMLKIIKFKLIKEFCRRGSKMSEILNIFVKDVVLLSSVLLVTSQPK